MNLTTFCDVWYCRICYGIQKGRWIEIMTANEKKKEEEKVSEIRIYFKKKLQV